jgi:hypothetical protein
MKAHSRIRSAKDGSGMCSSPVDGVLAKAPRTHGVTDDDRWAGATSAPSPPVTHYFPAIAMIHPFQMPCTHPLAPIVTGNQQNGNCQAAQTHYDSYPRFAHGILHDCERDQVMQVSRR